MSVLRRNHVWPRRTRGLTRVKGAIVAGVAAVVTLGALGGSRRWAARDAHRRRRPRARRSREAQGRWGLRRRRHAHPDDPVRARPGGTFGWHQHGGPVWVVVAQGTLTLYAGDEGCAATTVSAGGAFLDPGDHTHSAVNLGDQAVIVYATFRPRRVGQPAWMCPIPGLLSAGPKAAACLRRRASGGRSGRVMGGSFATLTAGGLRCSIH